MSYLPLDQMTLRDGPQLDAFGRLRVSDPVPLFASSQEYNFHPLVWDHYTVSGGTAVHSISTNSSVLRTNAATSGARAIRQTKIYYRYYPGKSHLVKMTGTLRKGSVPSGAAFGAIGYNDDDNGVSFRDTSSGVSIIKRSNTSGAVTEVTVAQSAWNLDKLDGTGSSGITADWTKEQIFIFDMQWLGVGRVRYGIYTDGKLIYVHELMNANRFTEVYMRTACLPLRYEVFNSGGAGSDVAVEAICTAIESEGGVTEADHYPFAYNAYLSSPVSLDTTLRPIVTRRLRSSFNGVVPRGHAHLVSFQLNVGGNNVYWEVRYNPTVTLGGGGSIVTTDVDTTNSMSEYDTFVGANNTVTGGVVMYNGFGSSGSGSAKAVSGRQTGESLLMLGSTYAGVRDTYVLCARAMTGTANLSVSVELAEQY